MCAVPGVPRPVQHPVIGLVGRSHVLGVRDFHPPGPAAGLGERVVFTGIKGGGATQGVGSAVGKSIRSKHAETIWGARARARPTEAPTFVVALLSFARGGVGGRGGAQEVYLSS